LHPIGSLLESGYHTARRLDHSRKEVIHFEPLDVKDIVNATFILLEPCRQPIRLPFRHEPSWQGQGHQQIKSTPGDVARACAAWGMVVSLRRHIFTRGMIQHSTPPLDRPDHPALIQAIAQRQDRAAFGELFRYFAPRIKAWLLRAGASQAAAEEMAQETMLSVWRKAASFDPSRAGATTWIFTIARNLRIDTMRRERHPSALLADPSDDVPPPEPADYALDVAERESRLRIALSQLPGEQAAVIRKAFFEDKAHSEIEQELGIPLGTVKSRLRLAMNRLRSVLGDLT